MNYYAIRRIVRGDIFYLSLEPYKNWTQSPVDTFFFTDKGHAEHILKGWDNSMKLEVVKVKIIEDK